MRLYLAVIVLVSLAASAYGDAKNRRPDLVLDLAMLEKDYKCTTKELSKLKCAVEEKCLDIRYGENDPREKKVRKLFRFNVQTWNLGTADARPPNLDRSKWTFHKCHQHLHGVDTYAIFNVLSGKNVVASGMKASFCLEDSMCRDTKSLSSRPFTCNDQQGIHMGCADLYFAGLDCQWVDVTYLKSGRYKLQVLINPERKIKELDYNNNAAICTFDYKNNGDGRAGDVRVQNCVYSTLP